MTMRATWNSTTGVQSVGLHLVAAMVLAGLGLVAGCDDEKSPAEPAAEQRVVELSRQLEAVSFR
jgi:hypothetical protein